MEDSDFETLLRRVFAKQIQTTTHIVEKTIPIWHQITNYNKMGPKHKEILISQQYSLVNYCFG